MVSRMDKPLTRPSSTSLVRVMSPVARSLLDTARAEADRLDLDLWAVGGPVRDAATGRAVVDVDLAANRDVPALATSVANALGATAGIEERFGTASIVLEGERLDLATLRAERYEAPGALPTVILGATIEDDLRRRDFSVNAIALGLTGLRAGAVLDPHGGLDDLAVGRFRTLHDRSFEDDATRIWRAARLSVRHDLRPTATTRQQLSEGARWLDTISGDRLWSEFTLIAQRGRAGRTLGYLDDWGALAATHEALALSEDARRALRHRWRPMPAAQLAAVLLGTRPPDDAAAALRRLNAPSEVVRTVREIHALLASIHIDPDHLETLASSGVDARLAARWLDPRQVEVQRALRRWERTAPHLGARELLAMRVAEGPALGELLRCLRRGRYLGTLRTVAEARALVRRHLDQQEGVE